jgi:hypothetical protein
MRLKVMLPVMFALWPATAAPPDYAHLANEAYIFGYPLVIMGLTEEVWLTHNRLNQFDHLREFPDYTFREGVRPNADTLYSFSWMDLGSEPVILSAPDTKGRYYLVQLMDAWTNTLAVPGTRTTGNKAGDFAIIGPRSKGDLPPSITALRSPTNMVFLVVRIQTNTAFDYASVRALQDQFRLTPWSVWGKPAKPAVAVAKRDGTSRTPIAEMESMDTATFFARLSRLMQQNPPAPADPRLVRRLEKIGIRPDRKFDFRRLPSETQQAIERGVAEAKRTMSGPMAGAKMVNGWRILYHVGKYGGDYLLRAQQARTGLGANLPEDALYPRSMTDAEGRPLEGSRRYVVHFNKSLLPPVNAFWSLTMYDSRGFFSENAIGRYAIGDRDQVSYNVDGSLDIYIQHSRPSAEKESNWLPAPSEPFSMSLRLYWPKPQALDGTWTPPPIRAVE